MSDKYQTWKLTDFNLQGQINLDEKFGLIKIYRSEDGVLALAGDADQGLIDQEKPSLVNFARPESILGFVLDIGIQKEKMLTYGHGHYFGIPLTQVQSARPVSQEDFDGALLEQIGFYINTGYQSGDRHKETDAIRTQFLFDTYNNARLLFPTFHAESYLSLMRILDALGNPRGRYDFATFVAEVSPALNSEICGKVGALEAYKNRIRLASELFDSCLSEAKKSGMPCVSQMEKFDDSAKFVFACSFSAYQYRNKFVHIGFPFPDTVKQTVGGLGDESAMAYLNPALGISWSRVHRPGGMEMEDMIDVHEVVGNEEAQDFKEKYFPLLPSWHFLKRVTRAALLDKINTAA